MKIQKEKFVALSYTLTVDGTVADQATKENPLRFVYGMGFLLPKFEENIADKTVGDSFGFTLTPEEGYGLANDNMIIDVPLEAFLINGQIEEGLLALGNRIPMMTQTGAQVVGIVKEVGEKNVKMDFNHPMAGKTLNFTGEIVEVRDATDEDYPNDHNCNCEGEYGHCDCGCEGECGDDCECGCHDGEHAEGCDCGHCK